MPLDLGSIRTVLFDMDGVLYRGAQPLPGVNEMLAFLEAHGIAYASITNNASLTQQQFAAKVQKMGLKLAAERIMTSSIATNVYLRSVAPRGTTVYAIGMDGLSEPLFGDGYFVLDEKNPAYVVVGVDFEVTYAKLRAACLAIRAGANFIGTNPDKTFPAEDGIVPGCGALLAALEAATSQKPMIIGKPEPGMFIAAMALLEAQAPTTLIIGDRYDTDILGGAKAGLRTAMVLTGVSTAAEVEHEEVKPDAIFADLPDLQRAWQAAL
ncbi:MAG: HAD-IIA family hydrolase [Chloroflexi bacterium]|nr:HAD-IIA family hydrolase [Chloroflexota bacterium]